MNQNTNTAFQLLSLSIREWLASESVALVIGEINDRLNFFDTPKEEVISRAVLRLCVQDLSPREFIPELSNSLHISFESAKTLTKEIEEKILKPIAGPLTMEVGLDFGLFYYAGPAAQINSAAATPPVVEKTIPPDEKKIAAVNNTVIARSEEIIKSRRPDKMSEVGIPTEALGQSPTDFPKIIPTPQQNVQVTRQDRHDPTTVGSRDDGIVNIPNIATPPPPAAEPELKPFILHQEQETPIAGSAQAIKPSFNFSVPLPMRPQAPTPPPKARIQTPPLPVIQRVVHYSGFFTRLAAKTAIDEVQTIQVPKSKWFI